MTFAPNLTERFARARSDLRMGVPVVMSDGTDSALVCAAETLTASRLAEFIKMGAVVTITDHRASTLKVPAYDGDLARVIVPSSADLTWVQSMADPADDLQNPMKGPFKTERDGTSEIHRAGIALAKAAHLLPACVVAPVTNGLAFALQHDLTHLTTASVLSSALSPLDPVIAARLPMDASEAGRVHIFRPNDGGEEHYAIEIGAPDRSKPVLSRLHSACFTGDVLGSLKCDCGPQLRGALAQMGAEGAGILLYLNQEGRGIGLANKMRAYSLQDQGFDTVEANHRLGFEDDERDFRIGAEILRKMGFSQVRLLTNNPAKVAKLESCGLIVTERVPLMVGKNQHNANYLATKAKKSGHLL
ncbi:GTP cyclohydrolase II [Octadecabacter sp. 1_MG-2023]|uniref:GTP cyclohydrolase II n=1 Tax=unclassified Octadecabacter TaxID=196158 RepID=UPI001C083B6C|nr:MULTISPECIES: GTP cyclohydrolase II [unclassified Octadecabacter]MBU2992156.1 GTP cyclohydrolase II [Octadecabacter sp. B2R22]MDO6735088.1 GTP cyclohydrolase II [Octadecabacter sp. 1_MG-2023]